LQGFRQGQNAFLLTIYCNQPNFRCGYFVVEAALFVVCDLGISPVSLYGYP
jgi:hypothetical protein